MALCGISMSSSKFHHPQLLIVQNPVTPSRKPRLHLFSTISHSSSSSLSSFCATLSSSSEIFPVALCRRTINLSILGFAFPISRFLFFSKAVASEALKLDTYTDSKEGFTLFVPSSWTKVDKAGATVLFEDASKKVNNVGIVVSPTRISSLGEFGNPQFVAEKLIQAERRKESTKEAEVISVSERSGHAGVQVYEFEYKVDSTRGGPKRVFSAAFVTSKRLYLLNITHSDGLENPLDMETRMTLEQVLHSFDAIPST